MYRRLALAALALALILGFATAAAAKLVEAHYDEVFPASEGMRLLLEQSDGEVEVEVWDRDEIQIQVDFRMEIKRIGFGKDPTFAVYFDERGDLLHVTEERGGSVTVGIFHSSSKHEYSYRVSMPAYVEFELRAEDGDVRVEGLESNVELHLDDGSAWLIDCESERVRVVVEDGDLHVNGGAGNYNVDCDDGNVSFRNVSATKLDIETEDGDVDLEITPMGVIDWKLICDDGRIDLDVSELPDAEIEMSTDDGRIRAKAPGAPDSRRDRERMEWTSGDGSGRILLESADGDVRMSVAPNRS